MRKLVVVAPGMSSSRAGWEPLLARLRAEPALDGAEWLYWDHKKSWWNRYDAGPMGAI